MNNSFSCIEATHSVLSRSLRHFTSHFPITSFAAVVKTTE